MKWLLGFIGFLLFGLPSAYAQTIQPARCQATLSVSTTAALLSTATIGPNTTGCQWPNAQQFDGYVWVLNESASASTVYLCPNGDTPANPCTTSNGLERAAGRSWGFYRPSSAMKVIGGGSATVQVQW